jgi:hypothetical protein
LQIDGFCPALYFFAMTQADLIFVRFTDRTVSGTYKNFPVDSKIVLVNQTTGTEVSGIGMTTKSDSGNLEFKLPKNKVPAGDYCLKALNRGGGFLAESVKFYVP